MLQAELEAGVQGRDHDQAEAEIDVRRQPRLEAPAARAVAPLAHPEQHQPDDQERPDRAQRVAEPVPPLWPIGGCQARYATTLASVSTSASFR